MNHLEEAGESYWEHGRFALSLSWSLIKMAWVMAMHAMFPNWQRFDDRIMPFTDGLKKTLTTRQLAIVHRSLVRQAVEQERQARESEDIKPTNGKIHGPGSNGGF